MGTKDEGVAGGGLRQVSMDKRDGSRPPAGGPPGSGLLLGAGAGAWVPAVARPVGAATARASCSLAWAVARSAASRSSSTCWALKLSWASVSAVTAVCWLDSAALTASSACCLACLAADSLLTCSVRARCRFAITCLALIDSV